MVEGTNSQLATAVPLTPDEIGPKTYLFYGPPGAGKTTAAAGHHGEHKLWLDMDNKLGELENLSPSQRSTITVWRCGEPLGSPEGINWTTVDPTRKDVYKNWDPRTKEPQGYHKLRAVTNELIALRNKGEFPYDLVVLDSLTRVSDHLVRLVMHAHRCTQMTETLWGVVSSNLNDYIQGFLNLPCDRIMIAHDKHQVKRDREGNILEETTRPMVVGQMANYLPQHFSEVYYFLGCDRAGKYRIQTVTDRVLPARTSKKLEREALVEAIFT